jgi:hypothetical protein
MIEGGREKENERERGVESGGERERYASLVSAPSQRNLSFIPS